MCHPKRLFSSVVIVPVLGLVHSENVCSQDSGNAVSNFIATKFMKLQHEPPIYPKAGQHARQDRVGSCS